jgi:micrococcal nuclease
MWRRFLALAVLCGLLFPPGALAHQAGCHWLHSCPSDRGNYVCGDLGHCGECPDNQFCQAGQPRQAVTPPPAPAPREAPPMSAADAPTPKAPMIDTSITGKTVAIVDGDTLEVLHEGTPVRVRLYGIDAPEKHQAFGRRAKRYLRVLALQHEVTVTVRDIAQDGRLVGEVRLADGRNLSQELVKAGLAWHDGQYAPHDTVLQQLQAEAQAAKRGLWSDPQPVPPWAFRREEMVR